MDTDTIKYCSMFGSCDDDPVVAFEGTDDSFWSRLSSGCCPWITTKLAQPTSFVERAVGGANSILELFGGKETTESATLAATWGMRLALGVLSVSMALVTYTYIVTRTHSDEPNASTRGAKTSAWSCSRCQKNVCQSYMHRFKTWLVHGPKPSTVSDIPPNHLFRFEPYGAKARQTLRKMKLCGVI